MRTRLLLSAILLSAAIGVPAAALAGDDAHELNRLNVPQDKWLSPTQITEKLGEKGYHVSEIEVDDGAYEVEMVDKRTGTRIEAHVHPATGELMLGYDDGGQASLGNVTGAETRGARLGRSPWRAAFDRNLRGALPMSAC